MSKITVTRTYLPDIEEFKRHIEEIWESGWITNHGPKVLLLESKLKSFLGVKHLFFVNNGTIALQIAIKALGIKGQILTTPFSYVATTSSIVWEGCEPIFVDIDPESLTIDPIEVRKLLNDNIKGILATHVYGYPCGVHELKKIADEFKIPIIYDAAHAFGVTIEDDSILNFGNISTLSFHATKLFHTIEGGAIITNDDELAHKISYLRNFGHNGQEEFFGLGINGKSSEVNAAMGLINLEFVDTLILERRGLSELYHDLLTGLNLEVKQPTRMLNYNYSYLPVFFKSEEELLRIKSVLEVNDIFSRRYFYPSLNKLPYVREQSCPVAENVSCRVLCLPLYNGLSEDDVRRICDIIKVNL